MMTWERVCELGLALPEVEASVWFRTPALKVHAKAFVRLKEDGETLVFVLANLDEQEMLLQARPELYFITDHYRGWPAVLARLDSLDEAECELRLQAGWRLKAPRKLIKSVDQSVHQSMDQSAAGSQSAAPSTKGKKSPRPAKTPGKSVKHG